MPTHIAVPTQRLQMATGQAFEPTPEPVDVEAELATLTAAVDVLLDPAATVKQKTAARNGVKEIRERRRANERDGR